jgi:hypothetical protein
MRCHADRLKNFLEESAATSGTGETRERKRRPSPFWSNIVSRSSRPRTPPSPSSPPHWSEAKEVRGGGKAVAAAARDQSPRNTTFLVAVSPAASSLTKYVPPATRWPWAPRLYAVGW